MCLILPSGDIHSALVLCPGPGTWNTEAKAPLEGLEPHRGDRSNEQLDMSVRGHAVWGYHREQE